jgi:hypothetical protein
MTFCLWVISLIFKIIRAKRKLTLCQTQQPQTHRSHTSLSRWAIKYYFSYDQTRCTNICIGSLEQYADQTNNFENSVTTLGLPSCHQSVLCHLTQLQSRTVRGTTGSLGETTQFIGVGDVKRLRAFNSQLESPPPQLPKIIVPIMTLADATSHERVTNLNTTDFCTVSRKG